MDVGLIFSRVQITDDLEYISKELAANDYWSSCGEFTYI